MIIEFISRVISCGWKSYFKTVWCLIDLFNAIVSIFFSSSLFVVVALFFSVQLLSSICLLLRPGMNVCGCLSSLYKYFRMEQWTITFGSVIFFRSPCIISFYSVSILDGTSNLTWIRRSSTDTFIFVVLIFPWHFHLYTFFVLAISCIYDFDLFSYSTSAVRYVFFSSRSNFFHATAPFRLLFVLSTILLFVFIYFDNLLALQTARIKWKWHRSNDNETKHSKSVSLIPISVEHLCVCGWNCCAIAQRQNIPK